MNSVALTAAGTPIVAGAVERDIVLSPVVTSTGGAESLIVAYSADNVYQWHQRFVAANGGINGAQDLAVTGSRVLVAGEFSQTMNTSAGNLVFAAGQAHAYLVRMDNAGVAQSAMQINGGTEILSPCIAGGWVPVNVNTSLRFNGTTLNNSFGFGKVQFASDFSAITQGKLFQSGTGGPEFDENYGCSSTADNSYFLTGVTHGATDFGLGPITTAGGADAFVAAFASDGQARWSKSIGGLGTDMGQKVEYSAAGAVVYALTEYSGTLTVGGTDTAVGLRDILITGYDPLLGTLKWSLPIGSVSNDSVLASSVDASGNLVFAASHRAPITRGVTQAEGTLSGLGTMLASVSPAGKLLWAMDLSDLAVADLAVAPSGDIYAVGNTADALITQTQTLLPASVDGFLIKLSWL